MRGYENALSDETPQSADVFARIVTETRTQSGTLDLSRLGLETLPGSIGQLVHLRRLWAFRNRLAELPEWMGQLNQIADLNVWQNQISELPESFIQLFRLRFLSVGSNCLRQLPKPIGKLSQLEVLNVWKNKLTSLPPSIGQLTQLLSLDVSGNQIADLPESMGQLVRLQTLDLTDNRLQRLPETLLELRGLKELYLHGNDDLGLPQKVLGPTRQQVQSYQSTAKAAAPKDILAYYFDKAPSSRRLNAVKLILVGPSGVGKTSVVNRLVSDQFKPGEQRTDGIKITKWPITLLGGEKVELHIWDFGGKEILHGTHQFFLTEQSLYVLVLCSREGQEDHDIDYWMRMIENFAGSSQVIIVLNKNKQVPFDLNRRECQKKYPCIRDFIKTDCSDGTGFAELLTILMESTVAMENVHIEIPMNWFAIKERISLMTQEHLTFDQYRGLCSEHGEHDEAKQKELAARLHNLGIALSFREDARLRNTHVLNAQWITEGIYAILLSQELQAKKGRIRLEDLSTILRESEYPIQTHCFLLDLMRKFDLCFAFPDGSTYLVPELLEDQEPAMVSSYASEECLRFQYRYPVLPEGLLPRFIVRSHVLSRNQLRWRTGVILDLEGNPAVVRADLKERMVSIFVSGPMEGRRSLLAVTRAIFEDIHVDLPRLRPYETVPLPGCREEFIPYADLIARERHGESQLSHVVDGKLRFFRVKDLLYGVPQSESDPRRRVRIFYSYSHKDEALRDELETHLKLLQWQGMIEVWHDRRIEAGGDWNNQIHHELEMAHIILLLVSADFLASDYCYATEMRRALERHEKKEARVVPIIIRACNWGRALFSRLKVLPKDGVAVTSWAQGRDAAWTDVSKGIEMLVEDLRKK